MNHGFGVSESNGGFVGLQNNPCGRRRVSGRGHCICAGLSQRLSEGICLGHDAAAHNRWCVTVTGEVGQVKLARITNRQLGARPSGTHVRHNSIATGI